MFENKTGQHSPWRCLENTHWPLGNGLILEWPSILKVGNGVSFLSNLHMPTELRKYYLGLGFEWHLADTSPHIGHNRIWQVHGVKCWLKTSDGLVESTVAALQAPPRQLPSETSLIFHCMSTWIASHDLVFVAGGGQAGQASSTSWKTVEARQSVQGASFLVHAVYAPTCRTLAKCWARGVWATSPIRAPIERFLNNSHKLLANPWKRWLDNSSIMALRSLLTSGSYAFEYNINQYDLRTKLHSSVRIGTADGDGFALGRFALLSPKLSRLLISLEFVWQFLSQPAEFTLCQLFPRHIR